MLKELYTLLHETSTKNISLCPRPSVPLKIYPVSSVERFGKHKFALWPAKGYNDGAEAQGKDKLAKKGFV